MSFSVLAKISQVSSCAVGVGCNEVKMELLILLEIQYFRRLCDKRMCGAMRVRPQPHSSHPIRHLNRIFSS